MRFLLGVLVGYSMRGKETTNHSPCDHSVHCLHNLAGNHALGAQFGR